MTRLSRNIFANFSAQAWGVGLSLIFTPFYIHALGVEAYGLIGIYLMLVGLVQVFDFGLGATINKELSSRFHLGDDRPGLRTLIRTAEVIYGILALSLAAMLILGAGTFTRFWINVSAMSSADACDAVMLMGILLGVQWLIGLYQNALMGMQEQVTANLINSAFVTIANISAAIIIFTMHASVAIYFICIGVGSVFQLICVRTICWRRLGGRKSAENFRFGVLKRSWGFTLGVAGISIVSVLLTQIDKILLSKLLSLSEFGLYVLAGTLSRALYVLITPIFNAVFPRLSSALAKNDQSSAIRVYHSSAQLMSVLVLSAAFSLAIFSHDIFLLWLRSESIAQRVAPIAVILAFGTSMNGLMNVPYAMQLAKGYTRVPFLTAMGVAVLFVPGMVWAAGAYGPIGAAWTWFALNFLYLIVGVIFTHALLLPGELGRWFLQDTGTPLMAIAGISLPVAWISSSLALGATGKIVTVLLGSTVVFAAGVLSAKELRAIAFHLYTKHVLSKGASA